MAKLLMIIQVKLDAKYTFTIDYKDSRLTEEAISVQL